MSWMIPAVTATLIGTCILTIMYWVIYWQHKDKFLSVWAYGWTAYTIRFCFELGLQVWGNNTFLVLGHQLTTLTSGILLLWGTYLFQNKSTPRWIAPAFLMGILWVVTGTFAPFSWVLLNLPTFIFLGLINIWMGILFLRFPEVQGLSRFFTGAGFILWGIHKLNYPFLRHINWFAPWGYLIAALLEFVVAAGIMLAHFERTRMRISVNEEKFRMLADNAQDLIYRYKLFPIRGFEYVSPSVTSITGYSTEEYYADPDFIFELIHPEDQYFLKIDDLRERSFKEPIVVRWKHKEGYYLWIEQRIVLNYGQEGIGTSVEGIGRDITERILAEEAVRRYKLLSEHARDIILFLKPNGLIAEANEAAVEAYGYRRRELTHMDISQLRAPQSQGLLAEQLKQAEKAPILFETFHQRKDGSIFPVEVSLQGTSLENERVLFAIVRDISERKKAEETIKYLAYHDPLTELPNRTLFFDRLNVALSGMQRNRRMLAVMFLDLDRFKIINDMMGHAEGDQLLKEVASQLLGCIRKNDTVARMGGDEFTILLPDIKRAEDAGKVAQKILDSLKKPWVINDREFQITASIGISIYPNDGDDAETLTKNADTAMYRAKEQGDNYQFFTPAMNTKAVERLEMELSLRKALENGEFQVYYQPQVNILKGRIVGTEALVRWYHPSLGMVMPLDFISIAEDTGLISTLGEWVLRTACHQNKVWLDAGLPPMRVAVNISAYQFRERKFVEVVAGILEETGMDPKLLELEITESTMMQDVQFSVNTLKKLRSMGIRIAIDDFGTGYSSLSYLRRFPITTLKVDRSFVKDVLEDVEDAAIVATIIVLAHNLKLEVIVEGIENDEQLAFFEQQECFEMQGYLFSEPVPAEVIREMLEKSRRADRQSSGEEVI